MVGRTASATCVGSAAALILLVAGAEEPAPPAPPSVLTVSPLALIRGEETAVTLRGKGLDAATGARAEPPEAVTALALDKAEKSDPPSRVEADEGGDSRAVLVIRPAADRRDAEFVLRLDGPGGSSAPVRLAVLDSDSAILEKEENDGFATAMPIDAADSPATVIGSIGREKDVDVFRLGGIEPGTRITAAILSRQLASAADLAIVLYDSSRRAISSNDEPNAETRDPRLDIVMPPDRTGPVFLAVSDALDRGGETHPYLLRVTSARADASESP